MKILFVSSAPLEYSASANMRNIALLKGFQELGNEIYTLTPEIQKESPKYDATLCTIDFKKRYWIQLNQIHSKVTIKGNKKNKIKNIVYKFLMKFKIYDFRSNLANKKIIIDEKFDIIISSSDPKSSHLIAESLIKNNPGITKKWIQYWGDPFAADINNKSFVPNYFIKKEENRLLSQADCVVYVSPFTLDKQKNIYPKNSQKMIFLPIPYQEKIFYDKKKNKEVYLGYFGDYFSGNRNILPLYNAIKQMKEQKLFICGNSDIKLEKKENIEVNERQTIQKIRELEAQSNILICVCNKKGTQIPGKIYHYAATNKPILIITDGDYAIKITQYLEAYDRFVICKNTEEDILNSVKKIINEKKEYNPSTQLEATNIASQIIHKIEEE